MSAIPGLYGERQVGRQVYDSVWWGQGALQGPRRDVSQESQLMDVLEDTSFPAPEHSSLTERLI